MTFVLNTQQVCETIVQAKWVIIDEAVINIDIIYRSEYEITHNILDLNKV